MRSYSYRGVRGQNLCSMYGIRSCKGGFENRDISAKGAPTKKNKGRNLVKLCWTGATCWVYAEPFVLCSEQGESNKGMAETKSVQYMRAAKLRNGAKMEL